MSTAPRERRQDERRVGDRSVFQELLARLERRHDGLHRVAVAHHVVRGDERERVGDVARKVVAVSQRLGGLTRVGPAPQCEQRERGGVAADRRLGGRSAELERPPGVVGDFRVAGEQRGLDRTDRASPGIALFARIPAFAPACGRMAKPLARLRGSPAISRPSAAA